MPARLGPPRKFTAPGRASLSDTDLGKISAVFNFIQRPFGHEPRLPACESLSQGDRTAVSTLAFQTRVVKGGF
jgi:hypothetical protein